MLQIDGGSAIECWGTEVHMAEILTPDLCVIGAGSGGLAVAAAARAFGASVVVVERGELGGDTLRATCVPSKALVAAGHHAHAIRGGAPFGIAADEPRINSRKLHDHIEEVIAGLAPEDSASRMEALGAEIVIAEASFIDPRTLSAGETRIRARRFVIATGSRSLLPDIPGLSGVPYFTTETIFDNTRKLTHLVIIGAGGVGLEIAQAYNRLGTEVTVVESAPPLPESDVELVEIALRRMREEGVDIRSDTEVSLIQPRSQGIGVVVKSGEREEMLDASHILVAIGRVPNLDRLDLDNARIRRSTLDPRRLELGAGLKTTNRRVYAIGDAAGGARMAHLAEYQAGIVVRSALFGLPLRQRLERIPSVTYTDPEIAEVGLTEAAARRRRKEDFVVTRWSFAQNDRARSLHQSFGVAKLITDRRGRILGAGIVGPAAGELIALFSFAIANHLSARHLAAFVAPYPTLSDIARCLGLEVERRQLVNPLLRSLMAVNRLLP
jgi:pyruvate/2-oxoglutarate dehydrogenase complex dihydrolipoamide dehydrogenase (E3) component